MSGIYVTPEILDRIKRIDIKQYLRDTRKAVFFGTNSMCPHPDHYDHNPSFSVWEKDGYYYWCCHACHVGKINLEGGAEGKNYGNDIIALIRWLSDFHGSRHVLTFQEAVKKACDYIGISPQESASYVSSDYQKAYNMNKLITDSYYNILISDKDNEAYKYLISRGLNEEDMKKWSLGYNGQRIVFPLFNRQKNILGFSNRVIGSADGETAKYKNSRTSEIFEKKKYLYGIHNIDPSLRFVYVAEGQMDVIMADKYDLKNVVASLGTAFTEEQAELLKDNYNIENIIFIFDGDDAGRKALARAAKIAREYGLGANFVELPDGKDLCDFALENKEKLVEEIKEREYYYFFDEFKSLATEYDQCLFRIHSKIMKKVNEVKSKINNENEKAMFSTYIADKFGLFPERSGNFVGTN